MLSNITMGQYYPVDSKVHRLDPRIKLILTIVFIVIVFMAKTFLGYAIILGFVWLTARLANVPFRMLLRGLKPLRIIIIITFLLNLFFTTGETVWVEFWVIRITKEGFLQAAFSKAQRFHLRTGKGNAGLVGVLYEIIVICLFVVSDLLNALFRHVDMQLLKNENAHGSGHGQVLRVGRYAAALTRSRMLITSASTMNATARYLVMVFFLPSGVLA